jgi:hypothetical protein
MVRGLKRSSLAVVALLVAVVLQSCAPRTQVVMPTTPESRAPAVTPGEFTVFYDSDPPGAVLYEEGKNTKLGETPFWVTYALTEKERKDGMFFVDPCRVVWTSGATATNYPGLIFFLEGGLPQTYRFSRPKVPGSEADYAYGLNRLLQRYANGEDGSAAKTGQ